MQYTLKQEIASFDGNAQRNFRKLVNSGIIQRIISYHRRSSPKPLEIPIPHGNSDNAYVLLTSVAAQQWRKRAAERNKLPKGYTRSPKLGPRNLAFAKGLDPTEPATYFSRSRDNITVVREGADLIVDAAREYGNQFPELEGLI